MNPFEFVIAIIAITTIGSIIRAKYGVHGGRRSERGVRRWVGGMMRDDDDADGFDRDDSAESVRLREEVRMLKERIQTLERITVDKESSLAREIDDLRNR